MILYVLNIKKKLRSKMCFKVIGKTFLNVVVYAVAGLLVVGGGVQSDETDRVWSEALFALTCCSSKQ